MKQLSFLISFCVLAVVAGAQNQFLLYSFKGNVSVVENNVESKAKAGKPLDNAATVKVASGGTATLICNEAAMFTITKPGTYQLNKFGDSCKVNNSSVSANYLKYVWAQMTKSSGSPGSNRKAYMNTVGAVSRGEINNVWVDSRLDTVNYSGGDFPLSWKSYAEAKEFDFHLFKWSNVAEPFYTTTVTKLKIPLSAIQVRMKPGESYYWIAAIKGEENEDRKVLHYVSKETFNAVLTKIKAQAPGVETPAEEAYRTAFMLEDAHYLSEAYQYYSKAATLDATNMLYRSTLMSFRKDYEIK
ncbi:MAG TPA: hypothetical protein VMZ03_00175 [Chitinophagaceae bacterium]|nr:hypothetical protein [Chitinophagaceae bacterium]